jgi:hypothetical protein
VFKSAEASQLSDIVSTRQDDKVVQLQAGWNLIPVLSSNNVNVEELFLEADIQVVKEVAGWRVFWPDLNINTLETVNSGKAYYVYANDDQNIIYPDLPGPLSSNNPQPKLINVTPWNNVTETPGSHLIGLSANALAELQEGDYLGAFTQDNLCAGLVQFTGENTALAVFGEDLTTSEIDGFTDHESIQIMLYRPETNETFDVDVTYNPELNQGNYEAYGLSEIKELKLSPTGISEISLNAVDVYPNPSKGIFNIDFVYDYISIVVYDSYGNTILNEQQIIDGSIDLSQHPNGVYYLRIKSANSSIIKKLVKE